MAAAPMAFPTQEHQAMKLHLRKHAVLFAQEVVCLQRPVYTAAWAASLHLVWYYLSLTSTNIVSTCCTVGFVAVAVDYAVKCYHRRDHHVRELLPPLLPATLQREQGQVAPSVVQGMDGPRTYAQLGELVQQCDATMVAVKDKILLWRQDHPDVFSGCMAAGCFVVGVLFNRVSGSFLLYLFVLAVLAVPILERIPHVRHTIVQVQPQRFTDFLATISVPPLAPHEDEVRHLDANMPSATFTLSTFQTPSMTCDHLRDELIKRELADYLKEEEILEQRREQRDKRSSSNADTEEELLAAATAAGISVEGIRRRHVSGVPVTGDASRSSREFPEDDGFSLVSSADAE